MKKFRITEYNWPEVLFLLFMALVVTALVIVVGVTVADADPEPSPNPWPTEPLPEPVDGTPEQQGIEQGYPEEGEIGEGIMQYAPAPDDVPLPDTGA